MKSSGQDDFSIVQLDNLWKFFQDTVFSISPGDDQRSNLFNPYNQTHPDTDKPHSAEIRRQNLKYYLRSFLEKPATLMLGEAPGWRGCRFTGVPFTSEVLFLKKALPFQGKPTSKKDRPYAEASATIFWRVMRCYYPRFMAWNCLPFHPHQPGNLLSNRHPSRVEIRSYLHYLEGIIEILSPALVIAVGANAQFALTELNIKATRVRHPSHGGAREFQKGVDSIFGNHME